MEKGLEIRVISCEGVSAYIWGFGDGGKRKQQNNVDFCLELEGQGNVFSPKVTKEQLILEGTLISAP